MNQRAQASAAASASASFVTKNHLLLASSIPNLKSLTFLIQLCFHLLLVSYPSTLTSHNPPVRTARMSQSRRVAVIAIALALVL